MAEAQRETVISQLVETEGHLTITGAPEGLDAFALSQMARRLQDSTSESVSLLHIARDDQRMADIAGGLRFFAPEIKVLSIPAWDCVPYDRVSPNQEIAGRRVAALTSLAFGSKTKTTQIVLTTVNSILQRVPSQDYFKQTVLRLAPGRSINMDALIDRLDGFGFYRTGNVMERGEYAVRGGILDLFPPGRTWPIRLDFFGDTLESIRRFDPATQRTQGNIEKLALMPISEIPFGEEYTRAFRQRYVELFGGVKGEDPLYEAVSAGKRFHGMEHWLPLFHEKLETIFDYLPNAIVSFDYLAEDARQRRLEQIEDHYSARQEAREQETFGAPPYKPVQPASLFMEGPEWDKLIAEFRVRLFSPFEMPESAGDLKSVSLKGKKGRNFSVERVDENANVFDAVVAHVGSLRSEDKCVVIGCWSKGACERIVNLLSDHGLASLQKAENWADVLTMAKGVTAVAVFGTESGFESPDLAVISEQDILGDRLVRQRRRSKKDSDVITEAASLNVSDMVVHADHGIGRFEGLKTIEAAGAPHDCLELQYHGGDKLYLPVENIELLTRFGSESAGVQLDRLGGAAWQARKSRLKKRIRDIADKLIKIAAMRELKTAPVLAPQEGLYEEFSARFPFDATEDQQSSIDSVVDDLGSGRPMDRLVCGDVGFGKTEVALRSAFITVMDGKQVAVVVPTTLLARQHYNTFSERFRGYPVRIAQASRLVGAKDLAETKKGIQSGEIDIVIGTHALLGKSIEFADLGLLIIDEEQHFGVQHKERLKELRGDIHVLTLTATPIPRTLQLALAGVRELSLITTPPLDRLAVRTFISPFDPVILREALLRERFRGGQSFYVCPRISDLDEAAAFLEEYVPELKITRAHGQMPPGQLEDVMNAFYDQKYDVLLSTTIVESGLDIPSANTLIVHRADMFGLSQLYQLRGRVGRSKTRAYAYFTIPANKKLTPTAEKRLKVLQSLDTLGAGFSLASHDLDIRGAGNLLGEEQSGHIKEVGFELYQSMLEEAVASLKGGDSGGLEDQWSPQISIGTAVLLPETFVPDLQVRLGLYRRLSLVSSHEEIEDFRAELVDRFGPLPEEVLHLLEIVKIKVLCRRAGISQVDAGPKGGVVTFRNNEFANPAGLIAFVSDHSRKVKLQPDHKLVYRENWEDPDARLSGAHDLVGKLADIAEAAQQAA